METEKRRAFIIHFLYLAIVIAIAVYLCRYALPALLPFVVALLVALLLKPIIRFLHEKCHVHKGIASTVVVLLFYALIGFLLTIVFIKIFSAAKAFFIGLPATYANSIQPWLMETFGSLQAFASRLDPQVAAAYDVIAANLTQTLGDAVSTLSKTVVGGVTSFTFRTPGLLLNVLIAIIATVFIAVDWSLLGRFISQQLSPKMRSLIDNIRTHLGRTLGRYIRSYALILLITFAELTVGLSIIGVENQFAIAAAIALFDILPVVGSGTVLIPWGILSVIQGDYLRALGLGIVYVVIIIVRNIIEPKIVGNHVGLHPIVTLSSMVVGTYIFGPIGLLGLPVTLALIKSLNDEGVIHLYDNSVSLTGRCKKDRTHDPKVAQDSGGPSETESEQDASAGGEDARQPHNPTDANMGD